MLQMTCKSFALLGLCPARTLLIAVHEFLLCIDTAKESICHLFVNEMKDVRFCTVSVHSRAPISKNNIAVRNQLHLPALSRYAIQFTSSNTIYPNHSSCQNAPDF